MARDVRTPIIASILSALALAPLALLAYTIGPSARVDASILRRLAQRGGTGAHELSSSIAHLADPLPLIAMLAAIVALGLAARRPRQTLAAVALVAGANLSTQVLKHLLAHPRFQAEFPGFHQPWADAFPSGHTTAAASIAVALVLVVPPRLRPLAATAGAAFTLAVGIAVVVLQWHYPSDVLGALLVVSSWTFATIAALRLTRPRGPASPPRGKAHTASGRFAISLE